MLPAQGGFEHAIEYYHKALGLKAGDTFTTKMLSKALEEECQRFGCAEDEFLSLGSLGGGLPELGGGMVNDLDMSGLSLAETSGLISNLSSVGGADEETDSITDSAEEHGGALGGAESSLLMDDSGDMSMQMSDEDD